MQTREFSRVSYLPFFDFGSNKGLCPLFQSPLFGVFTVDTDELSPFNKTCVDTELGLQCLYDCDEVLVDCLDLCPSSECLLQVITNY